MHMYTITQRRFIYEFAKIWCLYFGFPGRPRLNADCWLSRQLCRLLLSRQTLYRAIHFTIFYTILYHTIHMYSIVWIPFTHLQYHLVYNTCTIVHVVSAAAAANRRWQWQGQVNLVNLLPEFLCRKKNKQRNKGSMEIGKPNYSLNQKDMWWQTITKPLFYSIHTT